MNKNNHPNKLIHSSSPYLKQHAYNPVQWYPWGKEALSKARDEDKPLIISIGYSACHWCHVMERESFENQEIAEVMNSSFVCIKIDREERPDIDQIYMEAVQAMGVNGGWPLNVFALPDQKPFYGGTYFQPRQWIHILKSISKAYQDQRQQLIESATGFASSISIPDSEKYGFENHGLSASKNELQNILSSMKMHLDRREGGLQGAPKFPNPSSWKFLLVANAVLKDNELQEFVDLTLLKMACGGIYDQIGGGFARYSVDDRWFAPHFEKMLYDNGQLISLYSMAFQVSGYGRFKEVVYESIDFVKRELTSPDFGFYSALDADSEGEEGTYYIWEDHEFDELLGDDANIIKKYYQLTPEGNWERGKNILHISESLIQFCSDHSLEVEEFKRRLHKANSSLLKVRSTREKPGLDDKILGGWNGLMLKGLIDAYHAFGEDEFLELAIKNANFIKGNLLVEGKLIRSSTEAIGGYLEDYAQVIEAFFALHQATFESSWLSLSIELTEYVIDNFYDKKEELFFFTDKNAELLIARKKEIFDNVIPASNSIMAQNLFMLGTLLEKERYLEMSKQMMSKMATLLPKEPRYLTNWGILYALFCQTTVEIAIVGKDYKSSARELQKYFLPNKVMAATKDEGELPLLQNRKPIGDQTTLYVCFDKSCKLPVHSVQEALEQIEQ